MAEKYKKSYVLVGMLASISKKILKNLYEVFYVDLELVWEKSR